MTDHPKLEALYEFLRGGLSEEEVERIEAHLKTGRCASCLLKARELMAETEPEARENLHRFAHPELYDEEERDGSLEAALRQADRRASVIAGERALAPELLEEIERRYPAGRRSVIRTVPRYQLLGLAELLCTRSREEVFRDVVLAIERAELAVEVSDTLDPKVYVAITTADQRALARACLGNARRVASDLFGAEQAFQDSLLLLKEGNKGSPVRGDVRSLLGSLRIDQGRYAEAQHALEEALDVYRMLKFRPEEGKVLMKLADAQGYAGNPEAAVEILDQAVAVLEEVEEGRVHLQAHHNLTLWMVEAGQALEALARYQKAQSLYDEHCTEPSLDLRRRWLEGRIYAALGDLELAREAFEEVRRTAAERELSYELAMVSLELAIVHLHRGETARVQDLAEEMSPIFGSHELHRHALGAMYLFRDRARSDKATVGFLQEILGYLRRARNNPFLRFEPSARWG